MNMDILKDVKSKLIHVPYMREFIIVMSML